MVEEIAAADQRRLKEMSEAAKLVAAAQEELEVEKAALEASTRYIASSIGPKGHRCNSISAGPIKTLAAAGIKDFSKILNHMEKATPLRRTVTIDEVGNLAAFLLSDLSSAITGELIHADAGFHSVAIGEEVC